MIDVVNRWREFETSLQERGLAWGLHYAPAHLRYARPVGHRNGATLDHLLPADYRAFVAAVGYPVVGFRYYDREGLSFLPPEAMAAYSVEIPDPAGVWPPPNTGAPTVCRHAFFASFDLGEAEGYSFGPDDDGTLVVWLVEGGQPQETLGTFTQWLNAEITRLIEYVGDPTPDEVAGMLAKNKDEDDPHRLIDYSLNPDYAVAPYSADDLRLHWVESQSTVPYSEGLIDDATGEWLIAPDTKFKRVRPFRAGVAEVILDTDETTYAGPWTRIRPDGSVIGPVTSDA